MYPDLISIGFLHIKTYGCCMALGFLAAWEVLAYLCRRNGYRFEQLGNLMILLMLAGVLGSRIAYVIEHWQTEFAAHPWNVIRVDQGGLMFYGGLILATTVFFGWCIAKREHPLKLADMITTVLPLGHAFGRIGCMFYGCCYGKESSSALAVSFPRGSPAWYEQLNAGKIAATAKESLPVLPTQLFEAAAVLALFGVLFWTYRRLSKAHGGYPPHGTIMGMYFIGYAIIRFGMEYLRGDPRAAVGPFSISQTISIGLLAMGGAIIAYSKTRRNK